MSEWFDDAVKLLRARLAEARDKLSRVGRVVGYVSRRTPSKISENEFRVVIEVDPGIYFSNDISLGIGDYLVAVDIRTMKYVGLRIKGVNRADAASEIPVPLSINLETRAEGLITYTLLEAEPLLTEDGAPVSTPIEPQSPVAVPLSPELVVSVTGLPTEGITLGALSSGVTLVSNGLVPLKLPRHEFFKHMLIIGTTGSGKTTFIKNLIYSMLVGWEDLFISVIDAAGDYVQIAVPPNKLPEDSKVFIGGLNELLGNYPRWVTCLVPIRRRAYRSLTDFSRDYINDRFGRILRIFRKSSLNYELRAPGRDLGIVKSVIAVLDIGGFEAFIEVVPISLSYSRLKDHLDVLPLFSRQAKIYLRNILSYIENEAGEVGNFTALHMLFTKLRKEISDVMKLHKATLESVERVLNFLASSDDVDVMIDGNYLGIPPINVLAREYRGPVVLDLDYGLMKGSHPFIANLIAYEYLRSLYAWKKGVGLGDVDKPSVVVLDEAHRFFPSEGASYEEVEVLADFISMIARLGRAKGLGLIFSTHSPKDVHKIIIQLANTKVVFRSEKEYLEFLDLPPEYVRLIPLVQDRVGLLRSSAIRSGYALFKTSEPLLGHYDIGKALAYGGVL